MNRRNFLQTGAVGTAAVLTLPAASIFEIGCSTSWIKTVQNDLPIIVGIANSILEVVTTATGSGALAAAAGALITAAVNALSASLTALSDAVTAYEASTGTGLARVIAALTAAQSDIKAVIQSLPAGTISPVVMTIIVAGVGTIITILSSIQALIPGASAAKVTARATTAAANPQVVMPNSASLKAGYNSVLMTIDSGYESAMLK